MIFDKYLLVYIAIPKTGTNYIYELLKDKNKKIKDSDRLSLYYQHKHITYIQHQPEFIIYPINKIYRIFTFVRNPYERALSIFYSKDRKLYAFDKYENFLSFCYNLDQEISISWYTQFEYCRDKDNAIKLDFIGKIEQFEQDWNILKATICPLLPDYTNEKKNVGLKRDFNQEYSVSKCIDLVYKYFKIDFDTFGYSKEPCWH